MKALINLLIWSGVGAYCLYLSYKKKGKLGDKKAQILRFVGTTILVYILITTLMKLLVTVFS